MAPRPASRRPARDRRRESRILSHGGLAATDGFAGDHGRDASPGDRRRLVVGTSPLSTRARADNSRRGAPRLVRPRRGLIERSAVRSHRDGTPIGRSPVATPIPLPRERRDPDVARFASPAPDRFQRGRLMSGTHTPARLVLACLCAIALVACGSSGSSSSNASPSSSEVTVCAVPSSFSTVMVAPGLTESGVVKR